MVLCIIRNNVVEVNRVSMEGESRMVFQITLAGKVIEIHSVFKFVYHYCREYRTTEKNIDFIISTTFDEIDLEIGKISLYSNSSSKKTQYKYGYTEFLIILRKISNQMPLYSSFLFHGVVISDGKNGFILTAPSGTGKTTRARLLVEKVPEAFILNGDKPLIHIEGKKAVAYGTPWCGKEYIGKNTSIPIKAVFLLERSDVSMIKEIPFETALPELINQTFFPELGDLVNTSMKLLKHLGEYSKIYRYYSTSDALDIISVYELVKRV